MQDYRVTDTDNTNDIHTGTSGSKCRLCLIRDMADREDIMSFITRTRELLSPSERADDTLYEKRLSICTECPHLIAATCQKCGCYVEIRAAATASSCPLGKPKW